MSTIVEQIYVCIEARDYASIDHIREILSSYNDCIVIEVFNNYMIIVRCWEKDSHDFGKIYGVRAVYNSISKSN